MNLQDLGNTIVKLINDPSNDALTLLRVINTIFNNVSLRSSKDREFLDIVRPHLKILHQDIIKIKKHEAVLQEQEITRERQSIAILEKQIELLKRGEIK